MKPMAAVQGLPVNGIAALPAKSPNIPALQTISQPLKDIDHIRNVFPETWLWNNASIG